ncbi:FHA domain-containing protein [Streptomyces sp. FR-108]
MLLVVSGLDAGVRIVLEREVTTVGGDPESDVYIDDPVVSSQHCQICRNGDNFKILVTGNLRRICLNGKSVFEKSLQHGDEIQIGKVKLIFVSGASAVGCRVSA